MIDNIISYFEINNEEIVINKIFIDKSNYFCCLLDNSIAYFFAYLKKNGSWKEKELLDLSFFIVFKDKKIMEEEIKDKISLLGIETYINSMFLSNKKPYNIYDMNFNQIGCVIDVQNKILFNKNIEYFDNITKNDGLIKIRSLLIFLSNLKELRDYIPKKNDQIGKDNKIDITFLLNFFAVLKYIEKNNSKTYGKNNFDNIIFQKYNDIFEIFITQIQDLSLKDNKYNNINIFNDFHILIKIIIFELQKILYQSKIKQNFDYDEEILWKNKIDLNKNNEKLIIQKLFFFELEVLHRGCKCEDKKFYQLKYYLKFNLNENDKNELQILSLFDKLKEIEICKICYADKKIKRKLISLPEYLIIIVKDTIKIISTFLEKIDIKKFCYIAEKKIEYELIGFTDSNFRPIIKLGNIWKGSNLIQFYLSEERKMPNLLIYKKI